MKLTQRIAFIAASVTVSFTVMQAKPAQAANFFEVGEAGQSLTTAESVSANTNAIYGTMNTANDVDLYKLDLTAGLFKASTVKGVTNNLDTMLWLFDANGKGIVGNDDSPGTSQSTISANLTAGSYYLGISNYDIEPTSAKGFIFDYSSGSQKEQLLQATGAGSSESVADWKTGFNGNVPKSTGKYRILLNQSTVSAQPTPEPDAALGLAGIGLASLLVAKKKVARFQKA